MVIVTVIWICMFMYTFVLIRRMHIIIISIQYLDLLDASYTNYYESLLRFGENSHRYMSDS